MQSYIAWGVLLYVLCPVNFGFTVCLILPLPFLAPRLCAREFMQFILPEEFVVPRKFRFYTVLEPSLPCFWFGHVSSCYFMLFQRICLPSADYIHWQVLYWLLLLMNVNSYRHREVRIIAKQSWEIQLVRGIGDFITKQQRKQYRTLWNTTGTNLRFRNIRADLCCMPSIFKIWAKPAISYNSYAEVFHHFAQ